MKCEPDTGSSSTDREIQSLNKYLSHRKIALLEAKILLDKELNSTTPRKHIIMRLNEHITTIDFGIKCVQDRIRGREMELLLEKDPRWVKEEKKTWRRMKQLTKHELKKQEEDKVKKREWKATSATVKLKRSNLEMELTRRMEKSEWEDRINDLYARLQLLEKALSTRS